MLKNKLFTILDTFDRKEMTRFKEFSISPYHCKHEDTQALVAYCDKIYPNFNIKTCDRYRISKKLFPKTVHDQKKLALVFTYTLRLLEEFLIFEQLLIEKNVKKLVLLKKLRRLDQDKSYFKLLRNYQEGMNSAAYRDVKHYQFKFLLSEEANEHPKTPQNIADKAIIQLKQNNLNVYFMAEKLRDVCEMHVRSQLLNIEYEADLVPEIISHLDSKIGEYTGIPAVYLYYHLYKLIVEDREDNYERLFEMLPQVKNRFRRQELQTLYDFLRNYCLLKVNQGKRQYLTEVFRLYREELESKLIYDEDGILAEWHYKNIITAGIRLNEIDWVEEFIHSEKDNLHVDLRENAYSYNLANFYYATEEYDKAQDLLISVEYTDIRYSLNAKMLLLKLYFEKDEFDALQSLLESFRLFVHRNKQISQERYKGYYNLIKFARRVYNVKQHVGFSEDAKVIRILSRIEEELLKIDNIFHRPWLQSKIDEIKDRMGLSDEELMQNTI